MKMVMRVFKDDVDAVDDADYDDDEGGWCWE